jgi:FAD dependent oxidoreductase
LARAIGNAWAMKIGRIIIVVLAVVVSDVFDLRTVCAAETVDVVVYGGTSAGIVAAIQATRMGKSVVLIEPSNHLGGLTTGGLGATDIGNKAAIGGLARDFYHRVWKHYQNDAAWKRESRDEYRTRNARFDPKDDTMWTFEPHVATQIYREMLAESWIVPLMNERLDRRSGVKKNGARIESITMESGRSLAGRMFIDATYEGDLMAAAGVGFHVGREANKLYRETLNGVQPKLNVKNHRFLKQVDPFVKPGDPKSGLLWGVQVKSLPPDGSANRAVQAYCYRLCTTDVPENRRAWTKPADYDPARYELLLRNFEAGDHRAPWHPLWMPNRKTDTNNNGAFSTDYIGGNYAYPNAGYEERRRIEADHRSYQQGFLWTLANNPRVPEKVREEFNRLGLAKDEFVENNNWPTQLYVREARRMKGPSVMTEHSCRGKKKVIDSVGLGAYGMDSHNCQRYVTSEGNVQNEGDVQVGGFKPYSISYRSIIPKSAECENLLVPVCLSSSHIAYGSIRMEPVFMILGQSAATAAVMAIDNDGAVQELDYLKLRARLIEDKQVLEWPPQAAQK